MSTWTAVVLTALGCYAAKLLGLSVPQGVLRHPFARRLVTLLPVALLAALTAQQTFGDGGELILDAKAAGLGAAVAALLLRAPFLVVIAAAVLVTAAVRALGWAA